MSNKWNPYQHGLLERYDPIGKAIRDLSRPVPMREGARLPPLIKDRSLERDTSRIRDIYNRGREVAKETWPSHGPGGYRPGEERIRVLSNRPPLIREDARLPPLIKDRSLERDPSRIRDIFNRGREVEKRSWPTHGPGGYRPGETPIKGMFRPEPPVSLEINFPEIRPISTRPPIFETHSEKRWQTGQKPWRPVR